MSTGLFKNNFTNKQFTYKSYIYIYIIYIYIYMHVCINRIWYLYPTRVDMP